ncbi:DUF6090 family protein [uncultured Kordia sp.]|uniref:DUF6090 family protein n=1 Tax=uncultured Kordia sp. TaxID=507699 RepID=UPI0026298BF8|nr:DUF6090 family protein [uncultured Kordia sp.]
MKKINWKYALGEILLIFIGITLAITFQNWNENRKQAQLEKTVLKQLKASLQNDLKDVNANLATHQRVQQSCGRILEALHSSDPINDQLVIREMSQASDNTFLVSDVSTYEYLKSIGLHIIQDDDLRKQISILYEVVYKGIEGLEGNSSFVQQSFIESIKKYYTFTNGKFAGRKSFDLIRTDDNLKFELGSLQYLHQIMINRYQKKVIPELDKLIKMVEVAL